MCTVSWIRDADGYELFCNRDEKRTRALALEPEITTQDGVRRIAPTDPHAGGTWIGANEFGITLCLLNGPSLPGTFRSRGLILPELLSAGSLAQAAEGLLHRDLSWFAPFTLAILERGAKITVVTWDGQRKQVGPEVSCMPLISSSFDPEGVQAKRRWEFQRQLDAAGRLDTTVLSAFHASHGAAPDAYSPCMHRPDAETVSFSRVKVSASRVEFRYSAGAPCRPSPEVIRTFSTR